MKEKKAIIVYGLGKDYELAKHYIENKFNIIGYMDKDREKIGGGTYFAGRVTEL